MVDVDGNIYRYRECFYEKIKIIKICLREGKRERDNI